MARGICDNDALPPCCSSTWSWYLISILTKLAGNALLFGRVTLPTLFALPSPPLHAEWSNIYHDESRRKVCIIAPRGHAKSSIWACVFVLHHIFFGSGAKFVVLSSKTEGHAVRLLQTIKNALDYSLPLRKLVGYWGEHSARVWTRTEVVLKDGTMIMTRGTGQQVRGLKHGDQRPTLFVLDDPEDENNTKTAEAMEGNLRWLLQAVVPCLDAQRGRVIVIGTPQHQNCMVEVLAHGNQNGPMAGWEIRKYRALNDEGPQETWTSLWPEQWPVSALLAERDSFESIGRLSYFNREYQCIVTSDSTALFKQEYLRYYRGHLEWQHDDAILVITELDGIKLAIPEKKPVNVFMGIDPAVSTSETADYSVILCHAIDQDKNRYVLPYVRRRMAPSATIEKIKEEYYRWRPRKVTIETAAQQDTFREILRGMENVYMPGLGSKNIPRDRKGKRYLDVLEPWFFKRKVFLQPEMTELKNELLAFGPTAKHDDLIDALYWSFKGSYTPDHVVEERSNPEDSQTYDIQESWATA